MEDFRSLDALVRARLRQWPQRPPGLGRTERHRWLRGRPSDVAGICHPFLKLPGSRTLRTLPDGLWLHFGGTSLEPFVDIFAIEACASLPNLLDKRSRFAPSTHSLLAVCPMPWLLGPTSATDPTPRWRTTGILREPPQQALVLPVRDVRVLYALKPRHYRAFAASRVPQAHEYFMPMETLVAEGAPEDPAVCALLSRATAAANFLDAG
jgi:hypothetical protein